jgi:F-type H+-transporting ATPase subunit gamma
MGSIKNTKQITKAMELVSASKMRRAQESAYKSRDFRNVAREILTRLRQLTDVEQHPLFKQRKIKTRLHVVIASDRTLAGAYNSNIMKAFARALQEDQEMGIISQAIVIGRQAARFAAKLQNLEVVAVYEHFAEHPTANDIRPILNTLVDKFADRTVDAVDIIYTDYKTSLRQEVEVQRTLRLIEAQLSQAILESFASEHSMRMLAMKNASDNATEIIDDLTLAFNSARQASITQEIAEITGGAEAIA